LEEFRILYEKYTRNVQSKKDINKTWQMLDDLENIEDPAALLKYLYR